MKARYCCHAGWRRASCRQLKPHPGQRSPVLHLIGLTEHRKAIRMLLAAKANSRARSRFEKMARDLAPLNGKSRILAKVTASSDPKEPGFKKRSEAIA